MSDTETKRRSPGGIGITKRAGKFEATYNVPKEQLPPGAPRKRITAWGDSEIGATAALIDKLRSTELAPALPGRTTAADEKEIRDWLGPDGEDVKGTVEAIDKHDKGPLLTEWVEEWTTRWISPNLQDSTKKIYLGHIRDYIVPYLGKYHMNELYLNVLRDKWWTPIGELRKVKNGVITAEPLLGASVKTNIYKTMRLLITTCHKKHQTMIAIDSTMLQVPKTERPETDREVRQAAKRLQEIFMDKPNKEDPRWSLFMLALFGVRQAERLAIRVQDIELEDEEVGPTLTIHQQLDFDKEQGGWVIKSRTKNGRARELPLVGIYLEAVKKQLEWRKEWSSRPDWKPDPKFADLLFLQPGGKLWTRRQDSPAWHDYVGPGIRGHLARHITGHMLAVQGISLETAMELLGHSSEAMATFYRVSSTAAVRRDLERGQAIARGESQVSYFGDHLRKKKA
jgi:integrase